MFQVTRLRLFLTAPSGTDLTGPWLHSSLLTQWHLPQPGWGWASLRRLVLVGWLAIALWLGTAGLHTPMAAATATTPAAQAYDAGPIRQTHNPISGENFHGGVDPAVLDRQEHRRPPETAGRSLLQRIKDAVTGHRPTETSVDLNTQKNPTLERYPDSLR